MRGLSLVFLLSAIVWNMADSSGRAEESRGVPRLTALPADPLTAAERRAVTAWTLAQPQVVAHLAGSRTRLLRVGSDLPRDEEGEEYRRVTLHVRNYTSGLTHAVSVNLTTGAIEIRDLESLVQPNREEIDEGMAILARDPALAPLVNRELKLLGGFFNRSPYPDDPCSRDICLEYGFMKPGWPKGPARRVIVNLSRGAVAHSNFRAPAAGAPLPRMTEPGRVGAPRISSAGTQ